jgi:Glucoamylase and related glycosyl hydrolases
MKTFLEYNASWIWLSQEEQGVNQYVEFRREFYFDSQVEQKVSLFISSDSNYAVWINGTFINCGQFSNYPEEKTYDILDVGKLLKIGKNALCILVYYQGRTSFSYLKGEPGLLFALNGESFSIVSDNRTYCRKSRTYKNGPIYDITPQLSFAFEYNAAKKDDWLLEDYIPREGWEKARIMTDPEDIYQLDLRERPLKKLDIQDRSEIHIAAQGVFIREPEDGKTPAQLVQSDFMSPRLLDELIAGKYEKVDASIKGLNFNGDLFNANKGIYLILDLGWEEAGLFEMAVEADEGTIIDIAHGEHLDDLRVRASVGGRNFANRYICCEGQQVFTYPFKRFGCRFIEIHVLNVKDRFVFHYAGLRPTEYPIEEKGMFNCSDNLHNKIYKTSVRTLKLCMHEHYEDTPWREQALYGMDSRNQALCGYYSFGEYDFPEVSFSLLGRSLRDDGYLEIIAPSQFEKTIPSFCMAWILEVWEHYLYSGRLKAVKCLMPSVEKIIEKNMDNIQEGLLVAPQDKKYWNFYEWAEGLVNWEREAPAGGSTRYDAPHNLFFHLAINAASKLAETVGKYAEAQTYRNCADSLRSHFHDRFWDESKQLYKTYAGDSGNKEHFAELTQALALYAGVSPNHLTSNLRKKLASENNGMVKTTLSYSIYKYEALLGEPDKYAGTVFDSIAKDWGHMLYHGATSFWETIKGGDDFDYAGSLCHGWSAIPVYFYHAYILGIKPVEPGFRTFKAEPLGNVFYKASGNVPTPYGGIQVEWEKNGANVDLNISVPEGTVMLKS